jgi:phosphatidylglycerol:prolipoprotein diacylglycerol transferase
MCSELLRIPLSWNGVPIFGFGLLLAGWLAFGLWGIAATAKQAGWPAAMRAHLPTILIVAAAIALLVPRYFPSGVPVRGYGVMVLVGSIAGILLAVHRARQVGVAAEEILGLAVAMFIGGVIGARLFYVIEYWDERIHKATWQATLKAALSFTEGGLVIYGAFLGAMIAFAMYVRRRRLPGLAMADLIAPGMLVGLAFGRIGCLLNGCCYGGETNLPWAVTFPQWSSAETVSPPYADQAEAGRFYGFRIVAGKEAKSPPVIDRVDIASPADKAGLQVGDVVVGIDGQTLSSLDGARVLIVKALNGGQSLEIRTQAGDVRTIAPVPPPPRSQPVHPTQIYSAITAALLAWVLWSYYPFRRRDGEVTALMITLYPIARFLLETIRVDEPSVFGTGLSISQNLSVVLLAAAAGLWLWLLKKPAGNRAFPLPASPPA